MRRHWLLFSQTVTVLLAAWFIVATLQPQWLRGIRTSADGITLLQASGDGGTHRPSGSLSGAAQKASPAVVSINTSQRPSKNPNAQDPWFRFFYGEQEDNAPAGLGSGVIVSPEGHILTNNHVIEDADDIEVVLADGRRAAAKVMGTDPETDLALLKITLDKLPVIVLGQSEQLQVGDVVLAIGNPFGVGQTVTSGIVSALGRSQLGINTFENFIQTDAAINPGNSGGALLDSKGRLIGINVAIASAGSSSSSAGNIGLGFALPSNLAKRVSAEIIASKKATHGVLGAQVSDAASKSGSTSVGAFIEKVTSGGAAEKAGIKAGDVVTMFNGVRVTDANDLTAQVRTAAGGSEATVTVLRGGQTQTIKVNLGQL